MRGGGDSGLRVSGCNHFCLSCSKKRRRKWRVRTEEWRVEAVKEKLRRQISFFVVMLVRFYLKSVTKLL